MLVNLWNESLKWYTYQLENWPLWLCFVAHFLPCSLPMKFLLAEESRACFQPTGQAIRTVLCFIPPSPADWMSREKPSRRLEVTTTWEKPFIRSAAMAAFRFCGDQVYLNGCCKHDVYAGVHSGWVPDDWTNGQTCSPVLASFPRVI